jgi:hypothetical protein
VAGVRVPPAAPKTQAAPYQPLSAPLRRRFTRAAQLHPEADDYGAGILPPARSPHCFWEAMTG